MRLQSLVEVGRADTGVHNCKNNQDNSDNRETRQVLSDGKIVVPMTGLIHPRKFEDEIRQAAEKEENGDDNDCDRDGGNRQPKFGVCESSYNDQKLDREPQEEEEIELQERDVNLQNNQ